MKTIKIEVSETDYDRYSLSSDEVIKFADLVERISLEYARKALQEGHEIAKSVGLSKMTSEEIDAEIQALRNAKNNS